jgi:hypothetical protein
MMQANRDSIMKAKTWLAKTLIVPARQRVGASCFVHKTALHAAFISATYCSPDGNSSQ